MKGCFKALTEVKKPLFSFEAVGRLANSITFRRRAKSSIAEAIPVPRDAKSPAQLQWRHMYQKALALWSALSVAEKQEWESNARRKHMPGIAYFISQALKPNPGLYLPLQGGTMAGEIDMAKHRIIKLPLPTDAQHPTTKTYVDTEIANSLYTEGARVYHNVSQYSNDTVFTPLAFNSETYDTDVIHDPVTNNSRLTCKTSGKYIVTAHLQWAPNAVGERSLVIYLNRTTIIAALSDYPGAVFDFYQVITTIYDLSVGDYVELWTYQNSGIHLLVLSTDAFSPRFMMQRIG